MSFQPVARQSDTEILPSDVKAVTAAKQVMTVDDTCSSIDLVTDTETNANDAVGRNVAVSIAAESMGTVVHADSKQQAMQLVQNRPPCNTARNRMYSSQNSFNTLDFDYYDINDCSIDKNIKSKEEKIAVGDDAVVDGTESPTRAMVKSSSSSNIALEVQSLFRPPISSSTLPPQPNVSATPQDLPHSLFRSTSSESISMKHRYQISTQHAQHYYEKIRVGICAMDKKAQSQPMKEILSRLDPKGMFLPLRATFTRSHFDLFLDLIPYLENSVRSLSCHNFW